MEQWFRVVGTSHVAEESARRVAAALKEFSPDIVAVELDRARLHALRSGAKPDYHPRVIRRVGVRGYLFAVLGGWLQRKLGERVNITPGADMLAAVELAGRRGLRVALIDQSLELTLRRLSKALGLREAWQAVKDAARGVAGRERVAFDLSRVPEDALVARLLAEFRTRYPRPYRVLVTERNRHMAAALRRVHEREPEARVLVVVGAGHKEGLEGLLR